VVRGLHIGDGARADVDQLPRKTGAFLCVTAGEMVSLPLRRSLGMPATVDWRTRVYCPPSVSRCVRSPSESAELTF
jgi:hypothetical protein